MATSFSDPVHGVSQSEALREAAAYAPQDRVVLRTYEFTHSSFATRALVVIDYTNLTAKTETGETVEYLAVGGLRSEAPEESETAATPVFRLSIDGVSREIAEKLDLALAGLEPVWLIERIYVSDDLETPAVLPPAKAIIRTGKVTETRVAIEAGFGDPANQPFPRKLYTRTEHPGLVT